MHVVGTRWVQRDCVMTVDTGRYKAQVAVG